MNGELRECNGGSSESALVGSGDQMVTFVVRATWKQTMSSDDRRGFQDKHRRPSPACKLIQNALASGVTERHHSNYIESVKVESSVGNSWSPPN